MKQLKIFLLVAIVVMAYSCKSNNTTQVQTGEKIEPASGSIVYFQLDSVVKHYDMYNDLSEKLSGKLDKVQSDIQTRQRKLQNEIKDFQNKIDKGLLTRAEAEERQQVLANRDNDLRNYMAEKQQEMAEEEAVLYNKVMDAIRTFLQKINKEKKYSAIIGNAVMVGDPNLDITNDIIEGLNNEYTKEKKKSNSTNKEEVEESSAE